MFEIYKKINKKIRADGLFLGIYLIGCRGLSKIKSKILGVILRAPNINVGDGCRFYGTQFIKLGNDMTIYRNLWLEAVSEYKGKEYSPIIQVGDRVKFSNGVHISAINKITIGNDVLFGSNVYVSDHNHGAYSGSVHTPPTIPPAERELHSAGEVIIEDNVWIGDNVNIVGPVRIGFGAVIAANTVVRKDVPPRAIVAGIPARIIKTFNETTKRWERNL